MPILKSPGEPERAGEARRADSASSNKVDTLISAKIWGNKTYLMKSKKTFEFRHYLVPSQDLLEIGMFLRWFNVW